MKIALIAPSPVPFTIGGAEKLWWGLLHHINQNTHHQAELIKLPSAERNFSELIKSYHAFFNLDLSHFDCVISTKYPAWMVQHKNHICYLQHRLRGLYDTYHFTGLATDINWQAQHSDLQWLEALLNKDQPDRTDGEQLFAGLLPLLDKVHLEQALCFPGPITRAVVHFLDRVAINPQQIKSCFAISNNVKGRQDYFPSNMPVEVIHHPSDLTCFNNLDYGDLFTVSRLDKAKRIHLLIEAFKRVNTQRKFYIAGTGPDEEELKELAGDDRRIVFLGRQTDQEIIAYYSRALFVPFIPYDEDYGLITIEAMMSGKAVLTTTDAGGVNEFVLGFDMPDKQNGLSVSPTVEDLTVGMQQMLDNPGETQRWGENALQAVSHISWDNTLAPLLVAAEASPVQVLPLWPVKQWRPEVIIPSTFSIYPVQGGGQARMFHLYKGLAKYCNITLLSFGYERTDRILAPGLREIIVPINKEHRAHLDRLNRALNADIEDIAAIEGILKNDFYLDRLALLCAEADWVVASHPYLYHAIKQCWQGPVLYDAHNVELLLKQTVLKHTGPQGDLALEQVKTVEEACYRQTALVYACSGQDLEHFENLYGPRSGLQGVIGNGVDCQAVAFVDLNQRRQIRQQLGLLPKTRPLLFVGSAHGPNVEALLIIIELAKTLPEQLFWVVGSVCLHRDIVAKQDAGEIPGNLYLLGFVSEREKNRLMSAASLALNPMLSGSGSNLKMLDYAANGLPVLSTEFGNRGIDFIEGESILIADQEDFASVIERLQREDEQALQSQALRARHTTETQFDWNVQVENLWSLLKRA